MRTDAQIIELENKYWQAMVENDVDTALDLTDEPCIVSGASGVRSVTHAEFQQMMGSSEFKMKDFTIQDTEIHMLNRTTAVLAYTVREEMVGDGGEVKVIEAADSSTWIKREDGWKCAMHSEAILDS